MYQYHKPFRVWNGRMIDRDGQDVRLWGVNYYAAFNHHYLNLSELGVDHFRAVDRDIADFKRMGVNLVRMHVFDREISDEDGHILENHRLRVFDYLLYRLEQEGIYVMLAPIVWYNSSALQRIVTERYAYWSMAESETFGFSNFYRKHELIWNEEALGKVERYLDEFFARRNAFSGRRLGEMENTAIFEVINEPDYPTPKLISDLRAASDANPYVRREKKLLTLLDEWLEAQGLPDNEANERRFCAQLIGKFLDRTFGIVGKWCKDTVVRSHIHYGAASPEIREVLKNAPVEAISCTWYEPCRFESSYNDHLNVLEGLPKRAASYENLKELGKALFAYEFNMPSTLLGHYLPAFAQAMASVGVQAAAYFTYTPLDVAEYNPGWLVHYFNLRHTPHKGVCFAVGRKIFDSTEPGAPLPDDPDVWTGRYHRICRSADSAFWRRDGELISCGEVPEDFGEVSSIMTCGSPSYAARSGNGVYFMERTGEGWRLTVLPSEKLVGDPLRGRSYSGMANRYVDCNREPAVSRLLERADRFTFPFVIRRITDEAGRQIETDGHSVSLFPGVYEIQTG